MDYPLALELVQVSADGFDRQAGIVGDVCPAHGQVDLPRRLRLRFIVQSHEVEQHEQPLLRALLREGDGVLLRQT